MEDLDTEFFQGCGFKQGTISIFEDSNTASLWTRDAASVLQSMVADAEECDIVWSPSETRGEKPEHVFAGTMSGQLATDSFPGVEEYIMASKDSDVIWWGKNSSGPESTI